MSYGVFIYGDPIYGSGVLSPESFEFTKDLMRYLPPYWHTVREMIQLQKVVGQEIDELTHSMNGLFSQIFVETATWGLTLWERELGLIVDPTRPVERRREQIKAKLRGSGTTTVFLIQSVAEAYSGGEVEVVEHPKEYLFTVRFIGVKGIPPNMLGLMQAINEIKPAHLVHDWEYTWTWWDLLKESELTWDAVSGKTWNDLKVYE